MPQFNSKDEYEKWKVQRIKDLKENPEKVKKILETQSESETIISTLKGAADKAIEVTKAFASEAKKTREENKKQKKVFESLPKIALGEYIYGLPKSGPIKDVRCAIDANDFIFYDIYFGGINTLGRIPRTSIIGIDICDKSQISRAAIDPTGFLVGGTFGTLSALSGKQVKHKEFCVIIDWENEKGLKNSAAFAFEGNKSAAFANQAANKLKEYVQLKTDRLKETEKKCPYCAEIIKMDAKLCRYCNRDL